MTVHRLRRFIADMTSLVGGAWQDRDDAAIVEVGRTLLGELVKHDDWLPESMARCPSHGYAANLLWCDPFERFSVVSLVWAPGAETPVHDHQVWGLVGILRGAETSQRFVLDAASGALARGSRATLGPGEVEVLLPANDIHQVANARSDGNSISIHVYGGNIGVMRRRRFDPATGAVSEFVSGYANREMPNLWD
jgi:predicted metal-dependent enzyme (double-stranded beta helix superfamily)